jgi:hypothetical protein
MLAQALGLSAASSPAQLVATLGSDDLFVKDEDAVLSALLWLDYQRGAAGSPPLPLDVWRCVRFAFLSPGALQAVQAAVRAPPAAAGPPPLRLPPALAPHIAQQVILRSARQSLPGAARARFGHYAACDDGGGGAWGWGGGPPTPATAAAARPRRSYCFTLDVHGVSNLGRGLGLFFVWVDPAAPLDANDVSVAAGSVHSDDSAGAAGAGPGGAAHGSSGAAALAPAHAIPLRYRKHIAQWGAAYGHQQAPVVLNGAQCLLAVAEASCHPEFAAAVATPAGATVSTNVSAQQPPQSSSLLEVYLALARGGGWIQCVDIARLAVAWLAGGGSVYLDTDMGVGTHALPRQLTQVHNEAAAAAAPVSWPPSFADDVPPPSLPTAVAAPTPLLVLAQDADGLLQNNFVGALTPFHPFVTLLLRAVTLSALAEGHVVKATGPAMLTAVYYAFADAGVAATPSLLLAPSAQLPLGQAAALVAAALSRQRSPQSVAAPTLPALTVPGPGADADYDAVRGALPPPLPEASFGYLADVPRVAALADAASAGWAATAGWPPVGGGGGSGVDGVGRRPLQSLRLGDTVHICPPSTFYPRHWREAADGGAGGSSDGTGAAATPFQSTAAAPAAAAEPLSADAAQALALRQLLHLSVASGGDRDRPPPSSPSCWVPDVQAAPTDVAQLSEALRAARRRPAGSGGVGGRPPALITTLASGGAASASASAMPVPMASSTPFLVRVPGTTPGSAGSVSVVSLRGVYPHPGDASNSGTASPAAVRYGVHGWDCTWGNYPGGEAGAPAGYGGGYGDALESPTAAGGRSIGGYLAALVHSGGGGYGAAAAMGGAYGSAAAAGSDSYHSGGYAGAAYFHASLQHQHATGTPTAPLSRPASSLAVGASPLATADVFGVVPLARRVVQRMLHAGHLTTVEAAAATGSGGAL